jgi:hypothetical protein
MTLFKMFSTTPGFNYDGDFFFSQTFVSISTIGLYDLSFLSISLLHRCKLRSLWHWSKLRSLWHWPKYRSLWRELRRVLTKWQNWSLFAKLWRLTSLRRIFFQNKHQLWRVLEPFYEMSLFTNFFFKIETSNVLCNVLRNAETNKTCRAIMTRIDINYDVNWPNIVTNWNGLTVFWS